MSDETADNQTEQSTPPEQLDFSFFNKIVGGNSILFNPIWMNNLLKMQDTRPEKFSRENISEWMKNPAASEQQLRELNQYFYNTSGYYKRIVSYLSSILTFDYTLIPYGIEAKDVATPAFKKSQRKAFDFFEQFNVKYEFEKMMRIIIGEDIYFGYKRNEDGHFTVQKLPSRYCKLVSRNENGYIYAFDMTYFLLPGVNIDDYPSDFKIYYDDLKKNKTNTGTYYVILDPDKAVVFKFDENNATIIPPLLGIFLDVLEIGEYKDLIKTRAILDSYLLLHQKIPMRTDKDAKADAFLIGLNNAANFHANTKANTPQGVQVVTTPMDLTAIKMEGSQNKDSIIGVAEDNFYKNIGVSQMLFSDSKNNVGAKYSIKTDEKFVMHMYRQFERWVNRQLDEITGKYKFKILFPDITTNNQEDKQTSFLEGGNAGFSKSLYAASTGISPSQFADLMAYEEGLNLVEKLKPLQSAHTSSGKDGGAPSKKEEDLTASGMKTKVNNENDNKQ